MQKMIIIFLFFFSGQIFSMELSSTIEKIRPSIVSVGIVKPAKRAKSNSPSIEYRGTGFVVGDGHQVITNFHVLPEKAKDIDQQHLAVFVGRGKNANARQAQVLRVDKEHDLALLSISGLPMPAMTLGGSAEVREGQEIAFTGFPIGMALGMYPSTNKGIISAITPIVIPALSSRSLTAAQIRRMKTPFNVYQLDAIAYPGNSGSPVYEIETGNVVGVVNSVFVKDTKEGALKGPSGITYAIPVHFVKALLKND